ncbi:MAG: hypothetical protein A2255_04790 [Candidatus Melainabacteria bacterium RIFOXYA2_FULL_32_9]|nr:MAG: hypothetical protein A2255_04790 [Candidatus Melainabacteria bacterium RIFOXYA2_FULL_32_9]
MRIEFNSNFHRKSPIDPATKTQLDALGLKPTGSREGDLAAIEDALKLSKENAIDNNGIMPPPQTPPEIAAFMRSIGLEPTNSKEGDLIAVTNRLNQLEAQATSQSDLNEVNSLKSEWAQLTNSAGSSDSHKQNASSNLFTGQEQLAKLNKLFLNKKTVF